MTPEEANNIIEEALRLLGIPEKQEPEYFLHSRFNAVQWLPTYVWSVGDKVWAVELFRGDRVPEKTIQAMAEAVAIDANIQPAFFIPEGETYDFLLEVCRQNGIELITKISDEYEVVSTKSAAIEHPPVIRIPDWVLDKLSHLHNLAKPFRSSLLGFSRRYRRSLTSGMTDDESQEKTLHQTFSSLLQSDPRFSGHYGPLRLLRFFEQSKPDRGRDHYFHSFNNFLLGCIVIDSCYADFVAFKERCFPHTQDWSIEFTWLLTVLFHDVGYPIQKHRDTSEIIYGVTTTSDERAIAERRDAWQSPVYRTSRVQLVSLYEHLTQNVIASEWIPDLFPLQEHPQHPLDKAFERSFLEHGHGVASSMRMLADFFQGGVPKASSQRPFLAKHIFVSGLSIPFHDWPVRKLLREEGIPHIQTSRLPFAGLLMFIDSIQEDRRGETQSPDILTGLSMDDHTVVAEMNLDLLAPEKLREKRREARDVKDFLTEDLLHFEYPSGLL
jgi:hypothetical protein